MFKFLSIFTIFLISEILVSQFFGQDAATNNTQQENNTTTSQFPNRIDYGQLEDETTLYSNQNYEDSLYKLTLFNFEKIGEWSVFMPRDYGHAYIDEKPGAPLRLLKETNQEVQTISSSSDEKSSQGNAYFEIAKDPKKQILGLKVNFFSGRRDAWVKISPPHKVFLEGEVQGFEVWVAGRGIPHNLYVLVEDLNGKERLISLGKLNFQGWRRLSARVPETILQEDFRQSPKRGLTFQGIVVDFNLEDAFGSYYFYMDNLAVEVSRYKEEALRTDNPNDLMIWQQ